MKGLAKIKSCRSELDRVIRQPGQPGRQPDQLGEAHVAEEMAKVTGGLQLPPGMKLPF